MSSGTEAMYIDAELKDVELPTNIKENLKLHGITVADDMSLKIESGEKSYSFTEFIDELSPYIEEGGYIDMEEFTEDCRYIFNGKEAVRVEPLIIYPTLSHDGEEEYMLDSGTQICFEIKDDISGEIKKVTAKTGSPSLFLSVEGYEDAVSNFGEVLKIDYYNGETFIKIWSDSSQEDCTHNISLENACVKLDVPD